MAAETNIKKQNNEANMIGGAQDKTETPESYNLTSYLG
jgi:hypothetical protein